MKCSYCNKEWEHKITTKDRQVILACNDHNEKLIEDVNRLNSQ